MGSVRWAFRYVSWSPSRAEWLLTARCVQCEERDRIGHFVFVKDAKAAMAGRLLIRKAIAEKLKIPWNEVLLRRTVKGKPFLVNSIPTNVHFSFNVSHQGDYAVLAADPIRQVGIDVMKTDLPGKMNLAHILSVRMLAFKVAFLITITSAKRISELEASSVNKPCNHVHVRHNLPKVCPCIHSQNTQQIPLNQEETMLDSNHHVAVALGKPDGLHQQHSDVFSIEDNEHDVPQFTTLMFHDLVSSAIPLAQEDPVYWENFLAKQEAPIRQHKPPT
nr:PREDICTED: L-aminoadipate-semialdehyde dehydrogenase-phosphopantetheinyl transferase [Latimeria chalumnae]|eukprot:XP_014348115.1 PREDICTED: L-aminoadipate-semialdehyde dehydrogenase-phosphopantetheinyl transferase [Latimeria chalumnae]